MGLPYPPSRKEKAVFITRPVNLPVHMVECVQEGFDSDRWPYIPAMDIAVVSHPKVLPLLALSIAVGATPDAAETMDAVRSVITEGTVPTAVSLPETQWVALARQASLLRATVAELLVLQHFYAHQVFDLNILPGYDETYDAMWNVPTFQAAIREGDDS